MGNAHTHTHTHTPTADTDRDKNMIVEKAEVLIALVFISAQSSLRALVNRLHCTDFLNAK